MTERKRAKKSVVLKRLLKYLLKHWVMLIFAGILTFASNILALIAPFLSGIAVDAMFGVGNVDFEAVIVNASLMLLCYAVSGVLAFALSVLMTNLSRKVVYTMRKEVFEHLADLPVGYFDKNRTGDLVSRLTYDIDTVNASLSNDLVQIGTGLITVIGSAVMMVRYAPVLMLIPIATIPALVFFTAYRVRKVKPLFSKRSAKLGELNGTVEELLCGQKTIRAYGKEKVMTDRFQKSNSDAIKAYYDADYQGSVVGPSVNFINNISLSLIAVFGALLFIYDPVAFTIGDLSSFVLYSRKFSGPINETANIISEIQSALSAAERVFRLLDEKLEDRSGIGHKERFAGNVSLDDVSFGYDEEKLVLKNVSVRIKQGSTAAIVGPTGSGKTTIINLLMRFYDPTSGDIVIDGENSKGVMLDDVRSGFAMVLQDTWLFEGTVRANISYGRPDATDEEIENAAKSAEIHDYIMSLPEGYDTIIGENGVNISKGQKQLLTIARAILMDRPMLILDEATSNVDSRTEESLRKAMDAVMRGRTCIVVAHRLSTVANADTILVISDGRIIEAGTQDELLEKEDGFYRRLYMSQFET